MTRHRTLPILTGALLCASLAMASPAQAHGAHEHGVTYLDVILDGPVLAIDLRGAGHHLAGFEHAPETAEQREAWQAAFDGLGDAGALFVLPPRAGCSLLSAEVTPPAAQATGAAASDADAHEHAHHDRHDHGHAHHGDHGHDNTHGHGSDHDHGHDKDHGHRHSDDRHAHSHEDDADGHDPTHGADWQAHYRFQCSDASHLSAIEVGLFTAFPAHEEVRYQRFSDGGQDGGTLRPGRTRLPLR